MACGRLLRPLLDHVLLLGCEVAPPLALPAGGRSTPPDPLQLMRAARWPHQRMPPVCYDTDQQSAALVCPEACAPGARYVITSIWGSQGQRPGPGVQGAGW